VPQPYEIFLNVHTESVAARTFAELPIEVFSLAPTHRFGALGVAIEDFGATADVLLVLDCNEAAFGAAAREDLADDLVALLHACVADPDRRIGDAAVRPAALPPAGASPAPAAPPGAGLAERLAVLWGELLGCGEVGRDDDFFGLGGDSLLAYRMLARVRAELAVTMTIEQFLARPTIAALVEVGTSPPPAPAECGDGGHGPEGGLGDA
jgi:hypothetical protein